MHQQFYHCKTRRVLAQAKQWKNSYLLKPLNMSDAAVHLLRIDDNVYQGSMVSQTSVTASNLPLTTWHKRLGHLNFPSLRRRLRTFEIPFIEDARDFVCDSCQRAKASKIYNCKPQKRSEHPYQFIHTDLVGPISPTGFSGERYFFTFTDDCTRHTETYTGAKKSDWLHYLKSFHNLAKTRTKIERPTERIRSDYCSELQSKKAEQWLSLEGIILEPSAPYSPEENGVAERLGRTLMEMARATIIEGNIDDCFWSEVILAMTHIKNLQPTSSLKGLSPHEELLHDLPDLSHLRILGSTSTS